MAYWRRTPVKTADKEASNHGISAQKFQLIKVGRNNQRGNSRAACPGHEASMGLGFPLRRLGVGVSTAQAAEDHQAPERRPPF